VPSAARDTTLSRIHEPGIGQAAPSEYVHSLKGGEGKLGTRTVRSKHTESMSTDKSPQSVASAYFDAWKANDIERVRPLLHTDVDFVGALGKTHGVADTLSGLGGMFAMTRQVEVIHRWVTDRTC
jgi:hypothetical protein